MRSLQSLATRTLRRQRQSPLLDGRLLCTLSLQHPGNARIALLPSSPISPTNHRQPGTHTPERPAQTPTALRSDVSICANDVLAAYVFPCSALRATKMQAATHSTPFTKRHRTSSDTQPKRPPHTHNAPKTVRRSSKSCYILDTHAQLQKLVQTQTHWLNQHASPADIPTSTPFPDSQHLLTSIST